MNRNKIRKALNWANASPHIYVWAKRKTLSEMYRSDEGPNLYWWLRHFNVTVNAKVQLAIDAARLALPHSGKYHPLCLEAIEAAEAWLQDPSEANRHRCRDAGYSAGRGAAPNAAMAASSAAYDAAADDKARHIQSGYWASEVVGPKVVAECFRARISEAEFVRLATEAIERTITSPKP